MNVQELETAVRLRAKVTVVVWRDDGYGLIDWKQRNEFGRPFGVEFGNPDFVALARSFGMPAFRAGGSAGLAASLRGRSPSTARRWSRSRSTTARTCGSPSGSGRSHSIERGSTRETRCGDAPLTGPPERDRGGGVGAVRARSLTGRTTERRRGERTPIDSVLSYC